MQACKMIGTDLQTLRLAIAKEAITVRARVQPSHVTGKALSTLYRKTKRASLEGTFMMEEGRAFDIAVRAC